MILLLTLSVLDTQVSFVVKAVSALTAAFRLVQLDHCSQSVLASCLRQVHPDLHEDILTNLRKLSFTSMGTAPTEVKGTQHHFTRNGRLVANKQLVFQINQEVGMESVSYLSFHCDKKDYTVRGRSQTTFLAFLTTFPPSQTTLRSFWLF